MENEIKEPNHNKQNVQKYDKKTEYDMIWRNEIKQKTNILINILIKILIKNKINLLYILNFINSCFHVKIL